MDGGKIDGCFILVLPKRHHSEVSEILRSFAMGNSMSCSGPTSLRDVVSSRSRRESKDKSFKGGSKGGSKEGSKEGSKAGSKGGSKGDSKGGSKGDSKGDSKVGKQRSPFTFTEVCELDEILDEIELVSTIFCFVFCPSCEPIFKWLSFGSSAFKFVSLQVLQWSVHSREDAMLFFDSLGPFWALQSQSCNIGSGARSFVMESK